MALLRVSSYRKLFEEEQWSQTAGRCGVQARSAARSVLVDPKGLHILLVHFKLMDSNQRRVAILAFHRIPPYKLIIKTGFIDQVYWLNIYKIKIIVRV